LRSWRKRPKATRAKPLHTYGITRIKGTPAVLLGHVEATDPEAATKIAIERFGVTDPEQQKRLVARRTR
jgi:hypothetical protein